MAASWSFLTNHARGILFIAAHPDARIRDIAEGLGVTERTAFAILTDLTESGFVVKEKEGRRNHYHIQVERPLGDPISAERTIGQLLDLLVEAQSWQRERNGRRPAWSGTDRRRSSISPAPQLIERARGARR